MERTLPKGWKMVKLGEAAKIVSGSTPKTNKPEYWNGNILWATPADLSKLDSDEINNTERKITKDGYESCSTVMLPVGAVLLSSRAPIGHLAIAGKTICTNQGFKSLIPQNNVHTYYLYSALKYFKDRLVNLGSGATFKEISKKSVEGFKIPLPPLSTQKRIVEILEEADGLRKLRKEADEKMKDLIPSLFVRMFGDPATNPKGWEVKKLGEVCDVRDGTHDTPKYYQSGIPLITSKNLVGDTLDFKNVRYISEQDHKQIIRRSLVENGDILFAMIGTIGNPVIVKTEEVFSIKNVALFKFEKATSLINHYLKCLLSNQNVIMELTASAKGGNQKFVSLKMLRTLKIPIPPLPLQQEFAARVEEIEAEKARQAESKAKLDDLFNSLMQKAFKGELVA